LRWAAPLTWLPLLWPAPEAPRPGEFRLTVLDVGQGAAALIETARHRLLFDTGPGLEAGDAGKRIVLPYLQAHGVATLDALIISHGDSDHAGGARAVLGGVRVGHMLGSLSAGHALWREARQRGATVAPCAAGQAWQWDGVDFEVLWPETEEALGQGNHASCVLRVAGAAHAAMLAGDIDARAERALAARYGAGLRASVLLAPHHGSKTSSTEVFLDLVAPRQAVFQVGYRNRFKHPHGPVVGRYEAHGVMLSRSDRDGAVRFLTDGAALRVERYRSVRHRYWMGR
jgi:competence protein ComEC